jgi:hypothetical protein
MRGRAWIAGIAALWCGTAAAGDLTGAYFCHTDAVGGLQYSASAGKWIGTGFSPSGAFVLKVTRTGGHTAIDAIGQSEPVDDYAVDFTDQDSGYKSACGPNDGKVSIWASTSVIRCFAMFEDMQANLSNMRFLSTYAMGYLDGVDDNSNNPSIKAGTCVKIKE